MADQVIRNRQRCPAVHHSVRNMQGHRDPGVAPQQRHLTVSLTRKDDMCIYFASALSSHCANPALPATESIDIPQDG
jgi:hypothetical protein